jgi:hypothetical protein
MEKLKDASTPRKNRSKLKATNGDGSNSSRAKNKKEDRSGDDAALTPPGRKSKEEEMKDKGATAADPASTVAGSTVPETPEEVPDIDPLEHIPDEYRKHGVDTEPILYYVREKSDEEELEALLEAAQNDVRLHQARIRAAAANDISLLGSYDFTLDPLYLSRQERKVGRVEVVELLTKEARTILRELDEDKKNLTPDERTQVKLARWQRALELYVYCPSEMSLDLLGLLEKLLDGTSEVRGAHVCRIVV